MPAKRSTNVLQEAGKSSPFETVVGGGAASSAFSSSPFGIRKHSAEKGLMPEMNRTQWPEEARVVSAALTLGGREEHGRD